MTQFIPGIYNNFYHNILGYFWGVTYKACLISKSFKQKKGVDYFDIFAHVTRISLIWVLIVLALVHNLVIHQMDVKIVFLNGELEEEIYMDQPKGFMVPGDEKKVCRLVKSLYGLKQEPK